jgi:L-malate glycosyltransferase
MKILHTVESYEPSNGGMQEVVKQISEHLVKQGHQVTVATSSHPDRNSHTINGVTVSDFVISGNSVIGIKGDIESYQHFLLSSDFDIITNFAAQQWATDLMLPFLPEISAKKVFVPTGFSALNDPEYSEYFEKMKDWMRQYDMTLFQSDSYQDIEYARKHGITKIKIIPNGASAEEFLSPDEMDIRKDLGILKDQFLILHVGSHTGQKGHTEAIDIFSRSDLENATFIIVGSVFSLFCYGSCKFKEFFFRLDPQNRFRNRYLLIPSLNRKQIVELYKTADLFLFPSNIECSPIVLFECMASGTPFLTTDVGNAKEIIDWSGAGALLPTIKDTLGYSHANIGQSVKLLEDMYYNPKKRAEMKEAGFKNWREQFSWEIIAKRYEAVYLDLLG